MTSTRCVWLLVLCSLLAANAAQAVERTVLRMGGTGSAAKTFMNLAEAFQKTRPDIGLKYVPNLGSGGAIKALQAGSLEIALSARLLKDNEQPLRSEELGRTSLAVATGLGNASVDISLEMLEQMLDGRLTTWPDGSQLRLIMRPESDAETVYLRAISPRIDAAVTASRKRLGLHLAITDKEAADALEKIPGSLGLTTQALVVSEQRNLKLLSLGGKRASVAALANGQYPYYKPVFAVTQLAPPETVQAFLSFVKSRHGARILSTNGYLPGPFTTP